MTDADPRSREADEDAPTTSEPANNSSSSSGGGADSSASDPPAGSLSDEASASRGSTPPDKPAAEPRHASYTFLVVVTVVNLVADLWSKGWAKGVFEAAPPRERRIIVFEKAFDWLSMDFIFAKNKGGAWGLLQNETEALRRPFFLIVSVAAIVFIVLLYRKLQPGQTALKWGLPLVLGGALGNLVDRIRYGWVIDFIDIYITNPSGPPSHWPTFNVADIAICVGVLLMAVDMFTSRKSAGAAHSAGEPSHRDGQTVSGSSEPPPSQSMDDSADDDAAAAEPSK